MTRIRNPFRFDEAAARERIDRAIATKQVEQHQKECDCPICAINGAILGGMIANKDRLIEQAREHHRDWLRGIGRTAAIWFVHSACTFAFCLLAIVVSRLIP